ncbi:MAG: hypothetical protein KTR21_01570 [Rhodobacteraceae bacterium]|nr:hypothetical protein [Paracoccaceae bacterium]
MTSLMYDPWMAQRLWRRLLVGANQPLRLGFALDAVIVDGASRLVREESAPLGPLATLRRFRLTPATDAAPCAADAANRRAFLLSPPFSGAYSVILRDMAAALLPEGDVYVIEWLNVARVLDAAPRFDFDDQIEMIWRAIRRMGPGGHVVSVCQAGPPTLIAAAALGAEAPLAAPASLSLMSAPLQPSAAPSPVSECIQAQSLEWYRSRLVSRVSRETGARRWVYPADAQLRLMMSTLAAQSPTKDELSRLISRDTGDAPHRLSFLEMVTAYMDLPGEHFLSSLEQIYMSPEGAVSPMRWRGVEIPAEGLRGIALSAVEGGEDRVAAPGQTTAVVDVVPAAEGVSRRRILVDGLGHFGLFYGAGWREKVAPRLLGFIRSVERARARRATATARALEAAPTMVEAVRA